MPCVFWNTSQCKSCLYLLHCFHSKHIMLILSAKIKIHNNSSMTIKYLCHFFLKAAVRCVYVQLCSKLLDLSALIFNFLVAKRRNNNTEPSRAEYLRCCENRGRGTQTDVSRGGCAQLQSTRCWLQYAMRLLSRV
jgi:hypothetical protein